MSCAPRCSCVLILLAFVTTFGAVDVPTGMIEVRRLFATYTSETRPLP
jgi:hypothetical protein